MDIDFKKLAPWNWFKKEHEEQQSTASLPVQRNELPVAGGPVSPILQLHREIDRLFDDAFRGFGFPALAMPRWPSDWPGMLKPALDIQETDKQYKISLEVPGVEEKDIQITLDNDVLLVRCHTTPTSSVVTRPRLRKFLQDIAHNMPKVKSQHPAICWPIDVTQS